ncbi:PEP-CTERM sorting domain-containing protein [Falsiroseomonas oryzae]|uniref:PEP-CTERM sorting domain-containing protein n=1 Tax=Falsiroseomonas oryzae TaxID=2766473 RepID=UPI0022EA5116|nr:PEP-CTERM sorting domain-containing protein [Roseomonas sp. MO-31]
MKAQWLGAAALVALALTAGPQQAQAALVGCGGTAGVGVFPPVTSADLLGKVTNAAGTATAVSSCQFIYPADNNTIANIATINATGFFGFSDWVDNGQTQLDSNAASGSWSIADVDFADRDYIIVFKDGAGTNLTAFLFDESVSNGLWTTPFVSPPFDVGAEGKEVSHYTIAYRLDGNTNPDAVPEPASLALFGLGLLGLGAAGRRRWR